MELSKNDKIELTVDAVTSEGSGVGRYNGLAVFVNSAVPGDRLLVHIIKRSKNYAVGKIESIVSPSPSRIQSDCPYFGKCGGCSFRSMTYERELEYKLGRVGDALKRIGHLDIEPECIVPADSRVRYRNKAQYPVRIDENGFAAGFYAGKSHRIVPCADCILQPAEFADGIRAFAEWAQAADVSSYDESSGRGLLRHIYFRKAFATGEIMACAVVNGDTVPESELLVKLLRQYVKGLKSVAVNVNKKRGNVILGSKTVILWGSETITDILLGKRLVISPQSFYQVNPVQCERLYSKAAELACLDGSETLLDLYCGIGSVGLTMADRVKSLIGIEIVPQAVENAKLNAAANNVKNARYICADASQGAQILEREGVKPDVIILDPPRKGCSGELIDAVCRMSPSRIVYISCDSATLARDLAVFGGSGFKTERVCAVDMFPATPHVEAVCRLVLKN